MGQARLTQTNYHSKWPAWLQKITPKAILADDMVYEPVLINMKQKGAEQLLKKLVQKQPIVRIFDNYDEQLAELYVSNNAQLFKANLEVKRSSIADYLKEHYGNTPAWKKGSWVYYPWDGSLLHVLEEELFWRLRTLRNQILLTDEEQAAWRKIKVGCVGMSVGSNGAAAIALTSGSQQLKLADGAVFSGSNLNRVRTPVRNIGLNKCVVMAREIYEMNPYMQIEATTHNIEQKNIAAFFDKPWKLDLIVDEIDDLETKVRLRVEAKKRRIPVIMVTEPGNQAMLDVERYDLDPNLELFNGLAPGVEQLLTKKDLTQREKLKFIAKIIGVKNLPLRDQQAMLKVGATIPSAPQLGSTAMMAGGIIGFAARELAANPRNLKSGRHVISIEKELTLEANTLAHKREHRRHSRSINRAMRSM